MRTGRIGFGWIDNVIGDMDMNNFNNLGQYDQIKPNKLIPVVIDATTIPDAWFQLLYSILVNPSNVTVNRTKVEKGSFVGSTRIEFGFALSTISHPYSEPWDSMLPRMPEWMNVPSPVENGYIEQYMEYLMTGTIREGESYTYGERIVPQIADVIEMLRDTPGTNHAIIQIGREDDLTIDDPPCLRHIDLKVIDGRLVSSIYFRSWSLWGGLPANLAGLAVFVKSLADEVGVEIGEMVVSSKGLHLYDFEESIGLKRIGWMK